MFDPGKIVLRDSEFLLRPLTLSDVSELSAAANENRSHYLYNHVPDSVEATSTYIEGALAQKHEGWRYPFVILKGDTVVGTTSYSGYECWQWPKHTGKVNSLTPDVCEVGYTWLAGSAQRTRCNTVCKLLLFQHAFETWGVYRISIRTDERNFRSRRAIERVGGVFEGIKRADKPGWDGEVRDSAFYSIVNSEWPELKSRLLLLNR